MLSERDVAAAVGTTAYGADGDKLGTVEHFFVDDRTGLPSWVAVTTGLFGTRTSLVPVRDGTVSEGRLVLPVAREALRSAPSLGAGDHLSPDDEARLRRHYGLEAPAPEDAAWTRGATGLAPAGAGPVDDLPAGAGRGAATRTRFVKHVVTEEVQVTVPIRREEIRLEEVPLDALDPGPGESLVPAAEGRHAAIDEMVLHAERPVVTVEVVPIERVRLRTEVVDGRETVTGPVLREPLGVDPRPGG